MRGLPPRERLLIALSRRVPDRVPMDITGFNRQAFKIFKQKTGLKDPAEYFNLDFRLVGFKRTRVNLKDYAQFHCNLPRRATFNEWGTAFVRGSMPAFDHFVPPLTNVPSLKEIEEYPLPDFKEEYRHCQLEKEVNKIHRKQFAAIASMAMTIFEVSWQIRGFNELLSDFLINEEYAQCLLDRITKLRCFQAKRFAQAGVDVLHIGDDVGMQDRLMMSPFLWRKWLKPRLAQVIESVKQVNPKIFIFYHSDGYIEPIIPDLIEVGVNVLNPVQPECMDPVKLKKQYGDQLAFWGTVGIQTTLPFGTPEHIKQVVRERIETVGKGGGLIIAPTHVIEPEVPWENIMAFVAAVKEYGQYY